MFIHFLNEEFPVIEVNVEFVFHWDIILYQDASFVFDDLVTYLYMFACYSMRRMFFRKSTGAANHCISVHMSKKLLPSLSYIASTLVGFFFVNAAGEVQVEPPPVVDTC